MTAPARRGRLPAILDALPALCAPYIDPDAAPGSPDWAVSVAAANLRNAAQLLGYCLQDAERTVPNRTLTVPSAHHTYAVRGRLHPRVSTR